MRTLALLESRRQCGASDRGTAPTPLLVRGVPGGNIRQTGFAVSYQRVAENVWFPVSYGSEFRLDVLFGYKRISRWR